MTREISAEDLWVTKDEANNRIKVEQAYINGEPIEWYDKNTDHWYETDLPIFDWSKTKYRIGVKKSYAPLTSDDLLKRASNQKTLWFYNNNGFAENIAVIKPSSITTSTGKKYKYEELMRMSFIDGDKCCNEIIEQKNQIK